MEDKFWTLWRILNWLAAPCWFSCIIAQRILNRFTMRPIMRLPNFWYYSNLLNYQYARSVHSVSQTVVHVRHSEETRAGSQSEHGLELKQDQLCQSHHKCHQGRSVITVRVGRGTGGSWPAPSPQRPQAKCPLCPTPPSAPGLAGASRSPGSPAWPVLPRSDLRTGLTS